jgi:hypothetical protein
MCLDLAPTPPSTLVHKARTPGVQPFGLPQIHNHPSRIPQSSIHTLLAAHVSNKLSCHYYH